MAEVIREPALVVRSVEPRLLTDSAQGLTQAVVAPQVGMRLRLTELEAEGIMHRWHRDPASVPSAVRDRAFEVAYGKTV